MMHWAEGHGWLLPPACAEDREDHGSAEQLSLAYGLPEPLRLPGPHRERETGKKINSVSQTPREAWQVWG